MKKTSLNLKIEEAKKAEKSENYFDASIFYKKALELALKKARFKTYKIVQKKKC